jgi:steroid delta-isomerase-like uncharacterized protein
MEEVMTINNPSETAKAVVRRNTEEVQGGGNFDVFDELFADDFLDHTPQPGRTPDKAGARELYRVLRAAFPDFHADIHWQIADGDRVTTYKTYHGTHQGDFLGVPTTGRKIQFETVDVMRVRNGKIVEHWGVANLFSVLATARRLARQVGSPIAPREALVTQSQAGTAAAIPQVSPQASMRRPTDVEVAQLTLRQFSRSRQALARLAETAIEHRHRSTHLQMADRLIDLPCLLAV